MCEKVCLPAKARLELKLPSAQTSPHASAIDAALAAVPRALPPKDFGALQALDADSWRLCSAHEDGAPRDLFVEAPEGWWLKTTPAHADGGRDCFTLTIGDKPKDAALPVTLRLTLTGGAGPVETTIQAAPRRQAFSCGVSPALRAKRVSSSVPPRLHPRRALNRNRGLRPMTIEVGDRLPNVTVRLLTPDGPKPVETKDYFAGKKVVLFGLRGPSPRPATRTICPASLSARPRSRPREWSAIAMTSVNDHFVLQAWSVARRNHGPHRFSR